jgi:hypothetical protein
VFGEQLDCSTVAKRSHPTSAEHARASPPPNFGGRPSPGPRDRLTGVLGSALADPRSVSNDPKIARPRLKTIHGQGDGVRGRSDRPTVAHTVNLAASLEVLQPSERIALVQACGARNHRSRE